MIEQAKEVAKAIKRLESLEEPTELTKDAQAIAMTAIASFTGDLLQKALNISQAIVNFDDELNRKGKE